MLSFSQDTICKDCKNGVKLVSDRIAPVTNRITMQEDVAFVEVETYFCSELKVESGTNVVIKKCDKFDAKDS